LCYWGSVALGFEEKVWIDVVQWGFEGRKELCYWGSVAFGSKEEIWIDIL
jgi:hypothetical protein